VGTDKRARQREARSVKLQAEESAARRSQLRRRAIQIAVLIGVVVAGAFVYSTIVGGDDSGDDVATEDAPEETDESENAGDDAADEADETAAVTTTLADVSDPVEPTCPAADGSSPRQVAFTAPPPMCIDPSLTHVAQMETSRGDFEITLDSQAAPQTVNNFVFLARWHFYEGVGFHRIIPGSVVQGGDPVGPTPGQGGPGYQMGDSADFDAELPSEEPFYPVMSVAMANSGAAETNGSQFFIVTGPQGEALPNDFTRFGQVTAGEDVVRDIETTGTQGGEPSELTVIERITITEAP
jgi:cyclophilin family peptidyl-prolyl cis-trans isomerase